MKIALTLLTLLALVACDDGKTSSIGEFSDPAFPNHDVLTADAPGVKVVPESRGVSSQGAAREPGNKLREAYLAGLKAADATYQNVVEDTKASRDDMVKAGQGASKKAGKLLKAHGPAAVDWAKHSSQEVSDTILREYDKVKSKFPQEADKFVKRVVDDLKNNGADGLQNVWDELEKFNDKVPPDLLEKSADKSTDLGAQLMDFLKKEAGKVIKDASGQ